MIPLIYPELRWQGSEILPEAWLGPPLEPQSRWYCLGSCFAERCAKALKQHLISSCFAADGALYTPEAIFRWMQLVVLAGEGSFAEFERDLQGRMISVSGRFLHPFTPGWMEAASAASLTELVYEQCLKEYQWGRETAVILLTLGSSFSFCSDFCYWSNGHRLPVLAEGMKLSESKDTKLYKKLLEATEIESSLQGILQLAAQMNPRAVVVCSVSPIRHNLSSPLDNSLSKAQLLSAVHRLRREAALYYLPAYEIVMDELRDYRWYDEQLKQLRMDSFALILQRLLEECAGPNLQAYLVEVVGIAKMLGHRSRKFEHEGAEQALQDLCARYSSMNVSAEQYRALLQRSP